MATSHNILLLAVPDGQLLDVAGPLQMFAGANDELGARPTASRSPHQMPAHSRHPRVFDWSPTCRLRK